MRRWLLRSTLALLAGVAFSSCSEQSLNPINEKSPIQASLMAGPTTVRISQVYGGGGSTSNNPVPAFKNDYVELFNYGSQDVDMSGWRLQYASSTGAFQPLATNNQNTQFPAGTIIPAGKYFLVRLAAATGATGADINTFDASGNTGMAAGSGKLLLSTGATLFSANCPDDATIVDRVGYGAYTCTPVNPNWNTTSPTLNTLTAAFRAQNGCSSSGAFAGGVPAPRSLASPRQTCVSVSVSPASQSVVAGASTNPLTATETDAGGNVVSTTFTWTSSDNNVATVVNGVVTGVALGTVTITATATDGSKGTATVTVIAGPVVRATIDPTSATVVRGGTQQFTAKGFDAHDQQNTAAVFTWDTDNHSIATVDATGKVTTLNVGTVTVTATTNGVPVSATLEIIAPAIASVAVDPQAASTNPNATAQFTAMARDAGGHDIPGVTFTWASSNTNVATVDATGKATGKALGTVDITATSPNGKVGTAQLEVVPPPVLHITEIHYDNNGTDANEAIEIEGPAGLNLAAYTIVLYSGSTGSATAGQSYNTRILSGVIPNQCSGRGTISFTYPSNGIQNGDKDGMALVGPAGVIEFLSYEGAFTAVNGPAAGTQSTDIGVTEGGGGPATESLQRDNATGRWFGPETSNFGSCNPPTPPPHLSIVGRLPSDPALPVGFEDQLFANEIDAFNDTIDTNFTWESLTPGIATIDSRGVIHGVSDGLATFRATATDGIARNWSLPVATATAGNGVYRNNVEFGTPTDADPSNDIIVVRPQYTISYSAARNTPIWASYEINSTTVGAGEDRCDCFTFDPTLPSNLTRYNTADYTGAGAAAGFSIARGHLVRSFDRTNGSLDNAVTYYFTNIVPQAGNMNSGPWATLETDLGNLARTGGKEVYIMTGVIGSRGTVKNEGVITIPATMWKVAVIVPAGTG
ncbi:MAG TPA: Ig-like domain-containing protein, partial [Longimicrobiales bacterium]|nr:Ig-like domain-containing protein [Longimicrobiales bacterium]